MLLLFFLKLRQLVDWDITSQHALLCHVLGISHLLLKFDFVVLAIVLDYFTAG